jgi:hypothetical protein
MKRDEIINTVESFVEGTSFDPWEWDDFLSIKIPDQNAESVRLEIAGISKSYPPTQEGWWCSAEGLNELDRLIKRLKSEDW